MARQTAETSPIIETLVLGIDSPLKKHDNLKAYYEEFLSLVKTHGSPTKHQLFFKLRTIDSAYFLTSGKLDEVKKFCQEHGIKTVIFSEIMSVQQERNLTDYLECHIIDRTRLILEIFEKSAHSAEGKMQIAIALMRHEKARLAGKGYALSQQLGVAGARGGPGETLKERERRHIDWGITKLRKQLETLTRNRQTQRKQRQSSNLPLLCLVGYTNAGKSTILNALTKSDVLAENKLFATLDTTTRELFINSKKAALLSDTVGFIQDLPTKLVDAFKSTLSELQYANLLLHIVDIANVDWQNHIYTVNKILADLKLEDKPILYIFNKIDKVELTDSIKAAIETYNPHVIISAQSKNGIKPLIDFLSTWTTQENRTEK